MILNEQALATILAKKHNMPVSHSRKFIESFEQTIIDFLAEGDENVVRLHGFAKLSTRVRKGRLGVHPKTLEPMEIPSVRVVKFKASKMLKDAVK